MRDGDHLHGAGNFCEFFRDHRGDGAADARVIATGGLASVVADATDAFDVVDKQLTLKGICEIYRRMTAGA